MSGMTDRLNSHKSRRDVLRYGTVGAVGLLAGCLGGSGDGSSSSRFRMLDPETGATALTQRQCNPWNPSKRGAWHPGALIYDRPVVYSPVKGDLFGLVVTDWTKPDDTTLELTFSEDWTWHDGDPVVADDWVMQVQIALGIMGSQAKEGARAHQFIAGAEAVDEQTARIEFHEPLATNYAVHTVVSDLGGDESRGIFTKHTDDQWSEWHERLQNSEGDELSAVVEEIITAEKPSLEDAVGNGPFEVADVGDTTAVFERYDDHPNADSINFEECSVHVLQPENPVQSYSNDEVDAAHIHFPVADDEQGQLPDEHTLIRQQLSINELFAFNCGEGVSYDTPFTNRNVRKAVCHVFNRQQVEGLLQGINKIFDYPPCRVPGSVLSEGNHEATNWVSDFTKYGQNDTERATELLEGAGYERDGDDNWLTPDGERFEINVMNGANRKHFGVLKQNLNDFGIATNQEQVDDATFDERRQAGEYDMMYDRSSANGITAMWEPDLVPSWLSSIIHFSMDAEIPMPVGDPEGANGTKSINVEEHIRQWLATEESQYHKELMWWWNQFVPQMEVLYQPDAGAYNAANWSLNGDDTIIQGVEDLLYLLPKMEEATIEHTG